MSLNAMTLIVYYLAFVLGVLGNGVVIWVTGFKMKKTVNTVWVLNLVVANFLFTAFIAGESNVHRYGFPLAFRQVHVQNVCQCLHPGGDQCGPSQLLQQLLFFLMTMKHKL